MENMPFYVSIGFVITTLLTVSLFYRAAHNSAQILIVLAVWLGVQAMVALSHFYTVTDTMPPRFVYLLGPTLVVIFGLFGLARGRAFLDNLDAKSLTLLHTVRVPVELVLFQLFVHKTIPELMTYEGRNFDILSGITAPLVFYFGYVKNVLGKKMILAWNIVSLGLLFNIVVNAILSAPVPFQKFAFDQPNIAILYFPFVWLPCGIVPLVLVSHLACIRQLLKKASS